MIDPSREFPAYSGAITFFYYDDLAAAARWYRGVLGLAPVMTEEWIVLFELTPGHRLGLVAAAQGSQSAPAGAGKGVMLSIETPCLEEWFQRFQKVGSESLDGCFRTGCRGRTLEFRVRDPGGYQLEFFRWTVPPA